MADLPETMRAAVFEGAHQISVQSIPVPSVGPDDVLLAVDHCGICGSDLHFGIEGWGAPGHVGGHEYAGHIVALGDAVQGWSLGDLVVGGPDPCLQCHYCRTGRTALCVGDRMSAEDNGETGAYAEYKRIAARRIHLVPTGMSSRVAALTEPLSVAIHGVHRSGAQPGDRVLVTGAGPIGQLSLVALRAFGIEDVTVSEPAAARRAKAERLGAAKVVSPDELPEPPLMPMVVIDDAYDIVIECSGNVRAQQDSLGLLAPGGRLVYSGTGMRRPKLDPNRIIMNELIVTGTYNYDDGGFQDALDLLDSGTLPVDELIAPDDVPLAGLLDAMERLHAGEITAKVMVVPTTTPRRSRGSEDKT